MCIWCVSADVKISEIVFFVFAFIFIGMVQKKEQKGEYGHGKV